MYSESWNQIPHIIVLNYSLSVVSWRFHHFQKPNKPRVKYMFLKDNSPVPSLSYFSFCQSYYQFPKEKNIPQ